MMLIAFYVCFSTEVTFDYTSMCYYKQQVCGPVFWTKSQNLSFQRVASFSLKLLATTWSLKTLVILSDPLTISKPDRVILEQRCRFLRELIGKGPILL